MRALNGLKFGQVVLKFAGARARADLSQFGGQGARGLKPIWGPGRARTEANLGARARAD